jgi:hypothetical protein
MLLGLVAALRCLGQAELRQNSVTRSVGWRLARQYWMRSTSSFIRSVLSLGQHGVVIPTFSMKRPSRGMRDLGDDDAVIGRFLVPLRDRRSSTTWR